jgi:hypothetical protein
MNECLVITWTNSVPVKDGLAEAARDRGSQQLAAGPVHDAREQDSRPAPAGVVIARFSTEEAARSWFDAVLGKLEGTTLLAASGRLRRNLSAQSGHGAENCRPAESGRSARFRRRSGSRHSPVPSSPAHPRATGLAR